MTELTLPIPALLFPAISLLMLAYTNRFLALANLIRNLYKDFKGGNTDLLGQIENLRRRVELIKRMQFACVLVVLSCDLCMICILLGYQAIAIGLFTFALCAMSISLYFSLCEIIISNTALDMLLKEVENEPHDSKK